MKENRIYKGFELRHVDNSHEVTHGYKCAFRYWYAPELMDGSPIEGVRTMKILKQIIDKYLENPGKDYL